MDTSKNTFFVIGGAALLIVILLIFGISGAESNPAGAPPAQVEFNPAAVPAVSAEDNIRGAANPAVTLIEYSDIECPFCQNLHTELVDFTVGDTALEDFAWAYRHFPLATIHPDATRYAVATECAAEQDNFWGYLDTLTEIVKDETNLNNTRLAGIAREVGIDQVQFEECVDDDRYADVVATEGQQARSAGATGTPFAVFSFRDELSPFKLATLETLANTRRDVSLADNNTRLFFSGGISADQVREIVSIVTIDENVDFSDTNQAVEVSDSEEVEVVETEETELEVN